MTTAKRVWVHLTFGGIGQAAACNYDCVACVIVGGSLLNLIGDSPTFPKCTPESKGNLGCTGGWFGVNWAVVCCMGFGADKADKSGTAPFGRFVSGTAAYSQTTWSLQ